MSSRRLDRRPDWAAPSTSPSRRCLEVEPGELEAVERRRHRIQPLAGRRARLGLGDQQAQAGRRPRPMRPRSWWSCETPNRSASMTAMTVAFGTSTPTSMTVVATSTSISPAAKRRITSSFSSRGSRPCSDVEAQPGQRPLAQLGATSTTATRRPAGARSGTTSSTGRLLGALGSSPMRGAHDERLVPRGDLLAEPLPGPVEEVRLVARRHDVWS